MLNISSLKSGKSRLKGRSVQNSAFKSFLPQKFHLMVAEGWMEVDPQFVTSAKWYTFEEFTSLRG